MNAGSEPNPNMQLTKGSIKRIFAGHMLGLGVLAGGADPNKVEEI